MSGVALNQVPGWREALERARRKTEIAREAAWKNLPRKILSFDVRIITVRDYVVLDHFGSPFVFRKEPQVCDVAWFLWSMSPTCQRWNERKSQTFRSFSAWAYTRRVTRSIRSQERFDEAATAIFRFVEDMFLDAPPAARAGGNSGVFYLASWFDAIQNEQGLSDEAVWSMPLPQMFQRLKAIEARNGDRKPSFNREEDALKGFISRGIADGEFTYDDLRSGKAKERLMNFDSN